MPVIFIEENVAAAAIGIAGYSWEGQTLERRSSWWEVGVADYVAKGANGSWR